MSTATPLSRRRRQPPVPDMTTADDAAAAATGAESQTPTPLAQACRVWATAAARQAMPAVGLLGCLVWSFNGLIQDSSSSSGSSGSRRSESAAAEQQQGDPGVAALAGLLLAVTVVQVASAVLLLPPAGSAGDEKAASTVTAAPKKRKASKDTRKPNVIVTTVLSLILTAFAIPALHVVLVLFGAPFLVHFRRTLLCASLLAVLGLFPVVYTRGTDDGSWRAIITAGGTDRGKARLRVDAAVGGLWGACVGAWLGAVPIPLDWDRPWQQWPVTVVVGIFAGHAFGRLLGAVEAARR